MKKTAKKLALKKMSVSNLNKVKGGNVPYTDNCSMDNSCLCSLNPFECHHWSEVCDGATTVCWSTLPPTRMTFNQYCM
jgi:hypothetical protein